MDNSKAMQVLTRAYGMPVDPQQAYMEVQNLARNPGPLQQQLEQAYGTDIQTLARHAVMTWPSSTH